MILDVPPWRPVVPAITSEPYKRSPELLRSVVEQFEVERSPRYAPRNGLTFCNIFSWDVTSALGAEIPHWVDNPRRELTANLTLEWLEQSGHADGWQEVTEEVARANANVGAPAVVLWRNPTGRSGHIAVLVPSPDNTTRIAQAGRRNFNFGTVCAGFGSASPLRWFAHR